MASVAQATGLPCDFIDRPVMRSDKKQPIQEKTSFSTILEIDDKT